MRNFRFLLFAMLALAVLLATGAPTDATSPGATERVSVDSGGNQGNDSSNIPAISADGRYVAFYSRAPNLVSGDTNGVCDVFVHDRQTGTTERVNVDSAGNQADDPTDYCRRPAISADGRYIAFVSLASNLVPDDTNDSTDIFVRDRLTHTTERVSVGSAGNQADAGGNPPAISADGRYVAFESPSSNLVPGDTNGYSDIFVHDRQTGATERVSVDSAGNQANGGSGWDQEISADGRYVAFSSQASNLVAADTNLKVDVFVRDRLMGVTERVSLDSVGNQANDESSDSAISSGGRYVAFWSAATNLVPGDTNGAWDIFVHDRQTHTTERVSVDSAGNQANHGSSDAAIGANGRYVAFSSGATNLVPGDTNAKEDVFVHDRKTGTTERVSVDSAGNQADDAASTPAITGDGRYIAFQSAASNLVPGDTNDAWDIFVRDRGSLEGVGGAVDLRPAGSAPSAPSAGSAALPYAALAAAAAAALALAAGAWFARRRWLR